MAPRHTPISLSPFSSKIIAISLLLVSLLTIFIAGRIYASEYLMKEAQKSLDAGNSQKVYDYHLQALKYSPQISTYHLSFAEINFRLASALSQKESLTDSDRETISRLIQQSINSSKSAIQLRPNSAVAWISLAKIYQNLINVAEGSDNFAIEAYNRAVSLDRANPLLRLEFGNLLNQLSSKATLEREQLTLRSRAKSEFQTAIQIKSDYVNGYYNLAKLYETESDYVSAVSAMQQVLKYLDQTSEEYAKASSELEILKSKLPKSTPTPSPDNLDTESELSDPSPLPSPLPGGPVELQ